MKELITVRPDKSRLINILDDINKGRIKIPLFQREFVWQEKQILELFDSLEKGYPIGSLLFWKPEEDYQFSEKFGPFIVSSTSKDVKYVLDGFQRLSTLFGSLINPNKHDKINSFLLKKFEIYFDLFEEEFVYNKRKSRPSHLIPLYVLIDTFDFLGYIDDLRNDFYSDTETNELINRAKKLAKTFVDYEIPFIDIKGGDIKSAVDIFSRVNSTGTELSEDWMLSALSYKKGEFLLSQRIDFLLEELETFNFENLNRDTILHCIASSTDKAYFDVKVESLAHRDDFPKLVESTFRNIQTAVKFLVEELHVIEYRLLPYNNQLIFLTEFFRLNPLPSDTEKLRLIEWFWITSYSHYFTVYSLSKQRQALLHFKLFAEGVNENPVFYFESDQQFSTNPFPNKVDFGSVRSKTLILFMLRWMYGKEGTYPYTYPYQNPSLDIRFLIPSDRSIASVIPFKSDDPALSNHSWKKMDATFVLGLGPENWIRYFVDQFIVEEYWNNSSPRALERRKILIQEFEKSFVESLGIKYSGTDVSKKVE